MTAVSSRFRAELRARWQSVVSRMFSATALDAAPVLAIALLAVGARFAVNVVAAFSAHRPAHTRPTVVLRSE